MAISYRQATTTGAFGETTLSGSLLLYVAEASVIEETTDPTLSIGAPTTSGFSWTLVDSISYQYTDVIDNPGGGDCFSGNVQFRVPGGFVPFTQVIPNETFIVQNEAGLHAARLIVHEDREYTMIDMGDGKLVTIGHHLKKQDGTYCRADQHPATKDMPRVQYKGTVYNLHVFSKSKEGHHYVLENGLVAHNLEKD